MTGGFKLNGGFQTFFLLWSFKPPFRENHRKIYYHDAGRQGRNPGNTLLSIGFCMPGMIWRTAHCKTEDVKRMFWITSLRTTACMSLLIRERAWKFLRPWPSFNASQVYSNPLATPEAWDCTIVTQLDPFLRFPYLRHSWSCLVCIRLPKSQNPCLVQVSIKVGYFQEAGWKTIECLLNECVAPWKANKAVAEKRKHAALGIIGNKKSMFWTSWGTPHMTQVMEPYHLTWMTFKLGTWHLPRSKESC